MENSKDVCVTECLDEVNTLSFCLDRHKVRQEDSPAHKSKATEDCMPFIATWRDCCEKAKYAELHPGNKK